MNSQPPQRDTSGPYRPARYWSERLEGEFNLRGTGHLDYSETYNAWLYRAKRRALRAALVDVPAGLPALDIGSGVGWVVGELRALGLDVQGCDISSAAITRLQGRFPSVRFFQLALGEEPIDCPDGVFSVVTALDVMYHITDDAIWLRGLAEVARVLAPDGILVVSDGLGDEDDEPADHVRFRSAARWNQVETAGLRVTAVHPYFRWLSRDRNTPGFRRLPDAVRGPVEFALERAWPRRPHMRCAVLTHAT